MTKKKYNIEYKSHVTKEDRHKRNGHRGVALWLTGLSSAGKSTIAHAVEKQLFDNGYNAYAFDGDNIRNRLCGDLTFSHEGRMENVRRVCEVTKLFMEIGFICLCAFIVPSHAIQHRLRAMYKPGDFYMIHIDCPIGVCETRDVKGYYKFAREGLIDNFTGISGSYEPPITPDLRLNTDKQSLTECVDNILLFLGEKMNMNLNKPICLEHGFITLPHKSGGRNEK